MSAQDKPGNKLPADSLDTDYTDQLPRIPPVPPDKALTTFQFQAGFRLEQVAAEPLVQDPIALAFDEFGRLFVIEMRDYSEQDQEALGVVRLLTDRDLDGRFDESTIFAEGLSWPTAIACWDGGVLIGAAPHIYFCRDTNGDGRADSREIVFTGFERTNVQGLVNSFRWGPDNRLYGATSSSGAEVISSRHPQAPKLSLRRRDFVIEPRGMTIEATSGGGQHGQSFDPFGQRYVCANSNHIQQILYDDRYLARNPHVEAPAANVDIAADGPQAPVFRSSPIEPWRIVRTRLRVQGLVPGPVEGGGPAAGYFTGATGVTIYQGNAFGPEYVGNAFVADCGSNLVHRKTIAFDGLTAVARRAEAEGEFLRSSDIWFRPVQMANAPDGTLYIADMSREVIEHPKSLPPLIKQHLDLTSGRSQGRIYRVVPEGFQQPADLAPGKRSTAELVPLLAHANGWHRETAARLIYQRQDQSIAPALRELAANAESPEGRIRALYAQAGLNELTSADLLPRLDDAHARVREHAIKLAEPLLNDSAPLRGKLYQMVDDSDTRVRYQLAFSLGECQRAGRVEALLALFKVEPGNRWMQLAIQSSLANDAGPFAALLLADPDLRGNQQAQHFLLALVKQIAAQAKPADLAMLLRELPALQEQSPPLAQRLVAALLAAAPDKSAMTEQLAAATSGDAQKLIDTLVAEARAIAIDENAKVEQRIEAVNTLALGSWAAVGPTIISLIDIQHPQAVQLAALGSMARFDEPAAAEEILARFDSLSPVVRGEALEVLLSRKTWIDRLLARIEQKQFAANNVDAARRQMLLNHREVSIAERAEKLLNSDAGGDRAKVLETYQIALTLEGDADRGRAVFRKVCSACHRLEEHGHEIGKDLKSIRERGAATILTNVLQPNREVDPAYLNYTAILRDGRVVSGIIRSESATGITLQRAGGTTDTLPRAEIEELRSTGLSIMPEGLEREVDPQAMSDLIAYLLSM